MVSGVTTIDTKVVAADTKWERESAYISRKRITCSTSKLAPLVS